MSINTGQIPWEDQNLTWAIVDAGVAWDIHAKINGMTPRDIQLHQTQWEIEDLIEANKWVKGLTGPAIKNPDLFPLLAKCHLFAQLHNDWDVVHMKWATPSPESIEVMVSDIASFLKETTDNKARWLVQNAAEVLQWILAINSDFPINWNMIQREAISASRKLTK